MRAALLPTPGDPFMLAYWLRNFETWGWVVDQLTVLINGADPADVPLLEQMVTDAGGLVVTYPNRIGHDGAMLELLRHCPAEYVVLCEDDAYVRHADDVHVAFVSLEVGRADIIGSPRHEDYASSPLQEWPRKLTTDHEEVRRGLWPAFLFASRADLLNTDRQYGDRRWNLGETIEGLGITVTPELCEFVGIAPDYIHLDTLFGTTFQLRAREPRIELVHRVRLFDAEATETWIEADPPWFHVTGLSTLDQALGNGPIPDLDEHGGLWTRRVAWWWRTSNRTDIPGWAERRQQLMAFVKRTGMSWADIDRWNERFDRWVTWNEVRSEHPAAAGAFDRGA